MSDNTEDDPIDVAEPSEHETQDGKPRKNKTGRPPKLEPERVARIVEALSIGSYIESAASYAGVTKPTLYAWLKAGNRQKRGKYREFLNAVELAIERGELLHAQNVAKAGTGDVERGVPADWRASAWMLERKFPKRWGRREIVRTEAANKGEASSFNEESVNALLVKELDKVASEEDRWEE